MKGTKMLACIVIISLLAGMCAGCGMTAETATGDGYYAVTGMESTPIIEYTLPQLSPNVLVDRMGYQVTGEKEAAVKGKELPEEFRLVDAHTGEILYRGNIEKTSYDADAQLYSGTLVFEEFEDVGEYYLECDNIGRSYTFPVVDHHYIDLFQEASKKLMDACRENTLTEDQVAALITAYEWYPGLFEDEDKNEIPDVLELLSYCLAEQENTVAEGAEGAMKAALLAKFSYLYQKYDKKYATACLQKASAIFDKTQNTLRKDAESFFALTELYRASGLSSYSKQIADYGTFFENSSSFAGEREYLYGAMTYMVTRQKVDVELCNTLLDKMMDRGEEILGRYGDIIHPVTAKNNGTEDVLTQASEIVFVNYVLNSYQYHKVLQEFLHYLGGRNLQSVNFYSEEECADYLLILAQLASMPKEGS